MDVIRGSARYLLDWFLGCTPRQISRRAKRTQRWTR